MILGIDPGLSGALAVLHDDGTLATVWDMPTLAIKVAGKTRNRISTAILAQQIREWCGKSERLFAVLEDVQSMPRDGGVAAFSFGYGKGIVEGVITALGIPLSMVKPAAWKRAAGLGDDKNASRQMAMRMWPDQAHLFARVKDDGRAEAALIAAHEWNARQRGMAA